jgi:hypothetical protein
VSVLSIGQYFLERYFARGQRGRRAKKAVEEARAS